MQVDDIPLQHVLIFVHCGKFGDLDVHVVHLYGSCVQLILIGCREVSGPRPLKKSELCYLNEIFSIGKTHSTLPLLKSSSESFSVGKSIIS